MSFFNLMVNSSAIRPSLYLNNCMKQFLLTTSLLLLTVSGAFNATAQIDHFRFREQLQKDPLTPIPYAIENAEGLLAKLLADKEISVKYATPKWIYVQASTQWIYEARKSGRIPRFYYEFSQPVALNDTSRVTHFVNPVHNGEGGLGSPFTGKNVIIGYIDQGLDHQHPDFLDTNGKSRVLYYWDQTLPVNARTPQPYGYGQLWYKSDIDAGICTSTENSTAHGTSVAGVGSSNGLACGAEKGMAPDSKIIVIETNFGSPNWTLTVADACDFIFKKADSLGIPAVVNLSVGTYLGSHDGNDPASVMMESLLDAQPGRIIVCAAGNSGAWGKYHAHGNVDADTSFVWLRNNPSGGVGPNSVYFDLWTDQSLATWDYSLSANLNSGSFSKRGQTIFRPAMTSLDVPIFDTIYRGSNRIATVEMYPEIVDGSFHLEVVFRVDSTDYNFGFQTKGSGAYDFWSGASQGLNTIVSTLPSAAVYPAIIHYNRPDTLQTIVSSWNCSEKVISVGNIRNRFGHLDKNGNYYQPAPSYTAVMGQLSPNSSKGPNRAGVIKPDVTACGDVALSAGPLWVVTSNAYNSLVSIDGWHVRNGGTSMASPLVAGVAALYLEKCPRGTYQTFKDDLTGTAFHDGFTGPSANNAYGYGKVHALNLLLATDVSAEIMGTNLVCAYDTLRAILGVPADSVVWNDGFHGPAYEISAGGDYSYHVYSDLGCVTYSDTISIIHMEVPPVPVITRNGYVLSTEPYATLQWYKDGVAIPWETGNTLTISLPNTHVYTVVATGNTGCEEVSAPFMPSAGLNESSMVFEVYPNPAESQLTIDFSGIISEVMVYDLQGKLVISRTGDIHQLNIESLRSGTYLVSVTTPKGKGWTKFVRK